MSNNNPPNVNNSKKRKRQLANNPLSDARRHKATSAAVLSKTEQKAASLWHRKSGAGFSLFLSYYGKQPTGVVAEASSMETLSKSSPPSKSAALTKGAGQSRAAKRRHKKKNTGVLISNNPGNTTNEETQQQEQHEQCHSNLSVNTAQILDASVSSSKLVQVLHTKTHQRQHAHLTPFVAALSRPLPLTFRLRSICSNEKHQLIQELSTKYNNLVQPVSYDSSKSTIYQSIPPLCKLTLTKVSPSLRTLLLDASSNGLMARQELGSMLPVITLHAGGWMNYGSRVLDMCASPGSKTLQALEIVANDNNPSYGSKSHKRKPGRVVANDIHPLRLEALQDAVKRSGVASTLTSRLTYTNFDASAFPTPKSGKLFDGIIADVPCSGDGTVRKDAHLLPLWNPGTGSVLHKLQVRILERALRLVKVGGVVCYSTCSLNPVEDEAVVGAVLRRVRSMMGPDQDEEIEAQHPTVEIVEWPNDALPGLIRRNGVSHWFVADYCDDTTRKNDNDTNDDNGELDEDDDADPLTLRWYNNYKEAKNAGMSNAEPTLWPPTAEEARKFHLDRCNRLWPQDQDTGGFFVALLRKNREFALSTNRS